MLLWPSCQVLARPGLWNLGNNYERLPLICQHGLPHFTDNSSGDMALDRQNSHKRAFQGFLPLLQQDSVTDYETIMQEVDQWPISPETESTFGREKRLKISDLGFHSDEWSKIPTQYEAEATPYCHSESSNAHNEKDSNVKSMDTVPLAELEFVSQEDIWCSLDQQLNHGQDNVQFSDPNINASQILHHEEALDNQRIQDDENEQSDIFRSSQSHPNDLKSGLEGLNLMSNSDEPILEFISFPELSNQVFTKELLS
ncbi:hypothetical protein PGTUg99_016293 [Puccinia graminis f. sp. tritici]|uniref:Uncharacterized protein n=1 Tax=Puccinia graminis f. sp. tritici TaxID=56615 RepID=A0A5B0NW00_PUCGR|nr:hypothetical protein PGTUg99_016293 [Puccinia graminis f. sp. tritici]